MSRFTPSQSRLRIWLPAFLCYCVILTLAVFNFQQPVVKLFPFYDKIIHFLEFTVFGVFLGSAFLRERHYERLGLTYKIYLISVVIVVSALGELVQFFSTSRTPDFWDFAFNVFGCFTGLASYFFETGLVLARVGKISHYTRFAKYTFIKRIYFWLPPIIIYAVISFLSHQTPQDLYSKHLPLPQDILPDTGKLNLWKDLLLLHLVQFGPLGVFLARALAWETLWSSIKYRKYIILSGLFLMAFLSWFDEWHQGQIPGRVNDFGDVVFNFLGGIIGMLVYWGIYRHIKIKYFLNKLNP